MEGLGFNNLSTTTTATLSLPPSPPVGDRSGSPATEFPPESSDNGNVGNGKKPAWNKRPSNESLQSGSVMGGAWPALSESAKGSPKLSHSDSAKNLSDSGSVTSSQGTGVAPSLSSQSQLQSSVSSQKPMTGSVTHNQTVNHGRPVRQKSMKRDGGGNVQANGGFSHQIEGSHNHNHYGKHSSGGGYEGSSRENMQNPGNREMGLRNAGGDHPQPRNSFRRVNGGSHSRGDGSHQNYGGRRGDQDRGNHDWSHQRSFNGRDAPMQPRVSTRGYVRTPPVSAPFAPPGPPVMRPIMNPVVVPDFQFFYLTQGMPFVSPFPAAMYFPAPDPQLKAKLLNQIDYYFSNENLIKDTYLRQNMDKNGWVPVDLIAGFKKVTQLTDNIQLILEAVQSSSVVEVQGDKIRKRGDYMRWIMPSSVKFPSTSGLQSPTSPNISTLSTHFQRVTLDQRAAANVNDEASLKSSSVDLHSSPSHFTKDVASSSGCD